MLVCKNDIGDYEIRHSIDSYDIRPNYRHCSRRRGKVALLRRSEKNKTQRVGFYKQFFLHNSNEGQTEETSLPGSPIRKYLHRNTSNFEKGRHAHEQGCLFEVHKNNLEKKATNLDTNDCIQKSISLNIYKKVIESTRERHRYISRKFGFYFTDHRVMLRTNLRFCLLY